MMIVEKVNYKIKCDANGCKNAADFAIVNKKFIFSGNIYLCKNCIANLYGEISKFITPKSLKPIYKKGGKDE